MLKYAALGVLVRLALWSSPLQGYFASSMQCATPLTSAARRASMALHSTALCVPSRPVSPSIQLCVALWLARTSIPHFRSLSSFCGTLSLSRCDVCSIHAASR